MRVLVFGAAGQVGEELVRSARSDGHEVSALARADHDVIDAAGTRRRVLDSGADVVFNGAAYTAVDRAESEPELAFAINATAPGIMAAAAAEAGARFVHFSTDYVFDGSARAPIAEDAPPSPLGEYGRGKLAGEAAVREANGDAIVVRTAWVYGLHGHNFIRTVLRVTRDTGKMRVVNDQRGSPTWARDVARAAMRLVSVGQGGVYHLTNSGDCTWYDLAIAVTELAGVAADITPIPTSEYPTAARRPAYSVLAGARWGALNEPPLRPWREALAEFLEELEGRSSG